ncbi:MAG: PAS domain S-box protein [Spirochaetota bacterium]
MYNGLIITNDLFKKGPVIIVKWRNSDNWPIEYISPNVSMIMGYNSRTILENSISLKSIIHPEDMSNVSRELQSAIDAGEKTFQHHDYRILDNSGEWRWVQDVTTIIRDGKGNIVSFICYIIDITGRKHDEQELRQFKAAMEQASHIIYFTDPDGKIEYVNPAFENNIGYKWNEVKGKSPSIMNSGMMSNQYFEDLWNTIVKGDVWQEEITNRKKNGEIYTAYQVITPIKDEEGRISSYVAIQNDITDRIRSQQQLQDMKNEYESIFNNSHDAIFLIDVDSGNEFRFRRLNRTHEKATGLKTDMVQGKTPVELLGNATGSVIQDNYRRCVEKGGLISYEEELPLPSGQRTWNTWLSPIHDNNGRVIRIVGSSRDITEEKKLRSQYEIFFKVTLDMLCIAGLDGYFKSLSPTWSETLGWSEDELKSRPYIEFVHPDDRKATRKSMKDIESGENVLSFDNRYQCKDGTYRWLSWKSYVNQDEGLVYAVARDIQDRKEMEQELERLSTIDPLTQIYNRLKFTREIEMEINRVQRYRHPLSVIMFDIDHFKKINDVHGHLVGDDILVEVVSLVCSIKRPTDIFARWGGEEFIILNPETDMKESRVLAERIRREISGHQFPVVKQVTVSLGVTQFNVEKDDERTFLARLDDALYRAKNNGRNRTEVI